MCKHSVTEGAALHFSAEQITLRALMSQGSGTSFDFGASLSTTSSSLSVPPHLRDTLNVYLRQTLNDPEPKNRSHAPTIQF